MNKFLNIIIKCIFTLITVLCLSSCASPATRSIDISKEELRKEQQAQSDMVKSVPPKTIKQKHSHISFYEQRLQRIAKPLAVAASGISTKKTKCDYKYKIIQEKGLIAYTDGKTIAITPEMMDFLETDKELATVIAHELSHNIMGHHGKQMQNAIVGTIIDVAAATQGINTGGLFGGVGKMSYSQGFENEADYVAIYVMARAGYDINNVHEIWRKLTIQTRTGTSASFFSSHPSNPERYIRMKRTIAEVSAKKKAGKKLVPEFV